jgi:hypothetical protein
VCTADPTAAQGTVIDRRSVGSMLGGGGWTADGIGGDDAGGGGMGDCVGLGKAGGGSVGFCGVAVIPCSHGAAGPPAVGSGGDADGDSACDGVEVEGDDGCDADGDASSRPSGGAVGCVTAPPGSDDS